MDLLLQITVTDGYRKPELRRLESPHADLVKIDWMSFIMRALCSCSQRTGVLYPGLLSLAMESLSSSFPGRSSHSSCLSTNTSTLVLPFLMVSDREKTSISGHLQSHKAMNLLSSMGASALLTHIISPFGLASVWRPEFFFFNIYLNGSAHIEKSFILLLKHTTKETKNIPIFLTSANTYYRHLSS